MDAMVTSRMPEEKKRSGNRIIAKAGKTPSGFISEVYDYIIDEGALPDLSRPHPSGTHDREMVKLFQDFIDATVLPIPAGYWDGLSGKNDNELLADSLEDKHGPLR